MVVTVTWSDTAGSAAAVSSPVNWGNITNGTQSTAMDLYLWHDGANEITSCGFYVQAYSGTGYSGSAGTAADYSELIAWGDTSTGTGDSTDDGGFWINQTAAAFPAGGWQVFCSTAGVSGTEITLATEAMDTGVTVGQLDAGDEAHVQVKVAVPSYEDTAGTRAFDSCLKYTYTS